MELLVTQSIALILLLALSGLFSSSETVFFSLSPMQIRRISERHPSSGKLLHNVLANPNPLLGTILIGNTLINVAVAAVGYALAERLFLEWGKVVAIPAVTILLVVFGEIIPKRIGLHFAERLGGGYGWLFGGLMKAFSPIRYLLDRITSGFEPLLRAHGKSISEEEFETVLDISGEEGVINAEELAMLKAIVQLEDLTARHVMTPRVDIIGVDLDDEEDNPLPIARDARRKYILLYRDSLDRVQGFLDVRKYLLDPDHDLTAATLPPFYVPEGAPLNTLLTRFQRERRRGHHPRRHSRGNHRGNLPGTQQAPPLVPGRGAEPVAGRRKLQPRGTQPEAQPRSRGRGCGPAGRMDRLECRAHAPER